MNKVSKKINVKVLVIQMTCTVGTFLYVLLEKDGERGTQHFFVTVNFDNIVKVENELFKM